MEHLDSCACSAVGAHHNARGGSPVTAARRPVAVSATPGATAASACPPPAGRSRGSASTPATPAN